MNTAKKIENSTVPAFINGTQLSSFLLVSTSVVAEALAVSLDKPLEWATGFFFGNTELSLELWTVIAGISGFDD